MTSTGTAAPGFGRLVLDHALVGRAVSAAEGFARSRKRWRRSVGYCIPSTRTSAQGHSPHDAQDLTQGFFERLLQKDYLQ